MNKNNLKQELKCFVGERLINELWENKNIPESEYSLDKNKIIEAIREKHGVESSAYRIVSKLSDLHTSELVEAQEKAYSLGLKDGLNFKEVLSSI